MKRPSSISPRIGALFVLLLTLVVLLVSPFLGVKTLSLETVRESTVTSADALIFWRMRLPRVFSAFIAGASLAVTGLVFQSIFRNPLASPFTLGVSSGAAFGATVYFSLGLNVSLLGISGASLFALLGAVLTMLLLFIISGRARNFTPTAMLLTGVVLSFFFSSLIVFLQYISDYGQLFRISRWLMGSLETVGYSSLMAILPFALIGLVSALLMHRELDLLVLGRELARSRGLSETRARVLLLSVTCLLVGAIVSFCGPIGFVGIIVPHFARLLVGQMHRILVPTTLLLGGVLLLLCDTFARVVIAPFELPVGVVTALLGGPFFILLLIARRYE